jgi:hypothetical protein
MKRSRKSIGIADVTDLVRCEKPVRTQYPFLVQRAKCRSTVGNTGEDHIDDPVRQAVGSMRVSIDRESSEQVRSPSCESSSHRCRVTVG